MANEKLTDKALFPGSGTQAKEDLYHCVVVDDDTGSAAGTSTKQTYQQLQNGVNLLTEGTVVDPDADFVSMYDTSASASIKIHPQYLHTKTILANQTSSYVAVVGDSNGMIRMSSGSDLTVTINQNLFTIGTELTVYRNNTGAVTLVAGTGVTILKKSALTISARYGIAKLIQVQANGWVASGDLD